MDVQKYVILCLFIILFTYCIIVGTMNSESQGHSSGALVCKMFNTNLLDCSCRNLVDVPVFKKNWTAMLDLSHNQLKEIHGTPFYNLSILASLDLSFNVISTVDSTSFRGLCFLRNLDLSYNRLEALSSGVFSELRELVYLNMSANSLYNIPSKTLATLHALEFLYMSYTGSTLDKVISDFHNLTRLRILQITNLIVDVTNATFHPLAGLPIHKLWCTWLPTCKDCYFDKIAFDSFTSLRRLLTDFIALPVLGSLRSPLEELLLGSWISDHGYPKVINNTTFQVLSSMNESLKNLALQSLPLRHIENDAFMCISNLIGVVVQESQLQTLDKYAFRGLKALEVLYLRNNQLTAVPSDALNVIGKFKSLQYLDLNSNSIIAMIADDAFSEISSLKYLNLENNSLQDHMILPTGWLHLLRNLKYLVLGRFRSLSYVVEINLPLSLPSLQIFELKNAVKEITAFAVEFKTNFCSTFPNIATVIIYNTKIYNFPYSQALHKCYFLKELDLSGSIDSINSLDLMHTYVNISSLKDLTLARNGLESIEQIFFIHAPNLTSLNLSDNKIKNIDSAITYAFKRLIYLIIDGNALVSLSGIEHLTFLKHLDVGRNQINEVPLWLTSPTTSELVLVTLDLSRNPFSCTCKIEHFRKWMVSDTNTWLHPGEYNCATPVRLEGISVSADELDCRSFTAFYVGVSIPFVILFCVLIIFLIRYRWHIKNKLFLLYRNYRPFPEINEDFEMLQLQYHAYIAYNENSEDDVWVLNDLQPNMEEDPEPVKLCIKSRDFIPGHSLILSISENIQRSRKTILVLSPNFVESEWCYHEMEMAKMRLLDEHLDVMVLVLLKDIPNNKITLSLRQLLCKKEYLKWPKDRAGQRLFWQRLGQELKAPVQIDRRFCM